MTYHQEVILAMELDRSHIGKLVQMITDSWSMTGTLERVDQHDNREWEIVYPSRRLVPSGGEIYAVLKIGPWEGRIIGNQPVTVETVKGTLEAPETATKALPNLITEEESAEARAKVMAGVNAHRHQAATGQMYWCHERHDEDPPALEGTVVEPDPDGLEVHRLDDYTRDRTRCGLGIHPPGLLLTTEDSSVTCRECLAWADADPLPPEPPAEWRKAEPRPWLAANGNRFSAEQAKLITERLLYRPEE
jgi:hypothetical protein